MDELRTHKSQFPEGLDKYGMPSSDEFSKFRLTVPMSHQGQYSSGKAKNRRSLMSQSQAEPGLEEMTEPEPLEKSGEVLGTLLCLWPTHIATNQTDVCP